MTNSILYRLLRDFDLDLRQVPTVARRAGVTAVRHRKPSPTIDVFEGPLQLGQINPSPQFIIGIKASIGAILSLRVTSSVSPMEMTRWRETAEAWFHEVWTPTVG